MILEKVKFNLKTINLNWSVSTSAQAKCDICNNKAELSLFYIDPSDYVGPEMRSCRICKKCFVSTNHFKSAILIRNIL